MVMCGSTKLITFLLIYFITITIVCKACNLESDGETVLEDYMICKQCGSDVSISNFLLKDKQSPVALSATNITLFNKSDVLVQDLENPLGIRFRVILLKTAFCARDDSWKNIYTWFPGYAYKLCICSKCGTHLGWMFEPLESATKVQQFPSEQGFYAIILNNILAESYVNSLLMVEKYLRDI